MIAVALLTALYQSFHRVVRVKRNQESEVANVQSDLDSYDVEFFEYV